MKKLKDKEVKMLSENEKILFDARAFIQIVGQTRRGLREEANKLIKGLDKIRESIKDVRCTEIKCGEKIIRRTVQEDVINKK